MAFEENEVNAITLAKEEDAAIDFELSETKGGVSLYGFSNDETAGKTLYLDVKVKDGSRGIFGNPTKVGSVG